MGLVLIGFLASLAAGLVTALGAVPVLFGKHVSRRFSDGMLGFAAGVMLAASFFSLIIPGLDIAKVIFAQQWIAACVVTAGVPTRTALFRPGNATRSSRTPGLRRLESSANFARNTRWPGSVSIVVRSVAGPSEMVALRASGSEEIAANAIAALVKNWAC